MRAESYALIKGESDVLEKIDIGNICYGNIVLSLSCICREY